MGSEMCIRDSADDAVLVDTSEMTPDEVLAALTEVVERSAR